MVFRGVATVALAAAVLALAPAPARAGAVGVGVDVSYPQCGQPLPAPGAFAVVGVNAGLPFHPNPCLAEQLSGAGTAAQLYLNTANPGSALSAHWPAGQSSPQACGTASSPGLATASCSYDYGWNAATDAYRTAAAAFASDGLAPAPARWWLDVEAVNSWQPDASLNVAAIQGARDALAAASAAEVGLYGTPGDWQTIAGGTAAFASLPFWLPGATSLAGAESRCSLPAPSGGRVALVQFPQGSAGGDVDCATVPALAFSTPPRAVRAGTAAGPLAVRLPAPAAAPLTVTVSSASATGRFAPSGSGPWSATLTLPVAAAATAAAPFYYRDAAPGTSAVTAAADGYAAARQTETTTLPPCARPRHETGFEIVLGHARTHAAAMRLRRQTIVHANGKRLWAAVERESCTEFEVALTGFRTRAAALRTLRRLTPHVRGARVERG